MTKALSLDIRRRVVRYVLGGHSRREAAADFEVPPAFAIKLLAAHRKTGSYATKPEGGGGLALLEARSTPGLSGATDRAEA